jgi:signal peptidase II
MFRKKLIIVGAIVALILFLDQAMKIYTKSSMVASVEPINIFGSWLRLQYIENPGMAFGTTFGSGMIAKLSLSIFRIIAIVGIAWYWVKQAKANARSEFLIAVGFIFAGALGNLIDSMFYDYIFSFDPCSSYNQFPGSGVKAICNYFGTNPVEVEVRHQGFLLGNVVDMFQFNGIWPSWVPFLSGKEIFPAIWNLADGSITVGVIMVLIRQRSYFPKEKQAKEIESSEPTQE